ncbi:MAG: acetyl-CoA carboxylase, carboxyltransferase subunit beta [Gammaproteobacteria bacterium]|nr:acetyl-CoA carboxylase, carboxyltransferase subunit beta [Gammaproteobacteria bacterium]MDE0257383.1 acetyl-CoA carboxylase, carboxyltransferase subunit beta [Gammaproteobacteria bacterium]
MAWFNKPKKPLRAQDRRDVPSDVFRKCPGCGAIVYREKLRQNLSVCPECGFHFRFEASDYLSLLMDEGSFSEEHAGLASADPLGFVDSKPYTARVQVAEQRAGRPEAMVVGSGKLDGIPVSLAVMDFSFIGGSMGSVVGEKLARIIDRSLGESVPLVVVSASGGARMQEGILSLMQMAKTATLLARLHEAGLPHISILTNPTAGGVTASYAMLGDVNLAEPDAFIGFAGPRVIEETIRQELPDGFQRSEFLLEHGMLDCVVPRSELKATVALLLRHMWAGWKPQG